MWQTTIFLMIVLWLAFWLLVWSVRVAYLLLEFFVWVTFSSEPHEQVERPQDQGPPAKFALDAWILAGLFVVAILTMNGWWWVALSSFALLALLLRVVH